MSFSVTSLWFWKLGKDKSCWIGCSHSLKEMGTPAQAVDVQMLGCSSCRHHPSLEAGGLVQSHKHWKGSHRRRHFRIGGENTAICISRRIWGMSGTAASLQGAYRDILEMVETYVAMTWEMEIYAYPGLLPCM